jgi:hypothetical protein
MSIRITIATGLALAGCAADPALPTSSPDGGAEDEIGELQQSLTVVVRDTFESHPLGPLGAPWSVDPGDSAHLATVVATADHGRALQMDGPTTLGYWLLATRTFSSDATTIRARVDVKPSPGSAFLWILDGAGSSIGRRRIRLQRAPGSTTLEAQTVPSGTTTCGTVPSGTWSRVTLVVHARAWPHTFDVLIDGAPTACTGVDAGISPPFNGVQAMDASNEDWGGIVLFDNVLVSNPL